MMTAGGFSMPACSRYYVPFLAHENRLEAGLMRLWHMFGEVGVWSGKGAESGTMNSFRGCSQVHSARSPVVSTRAEVKGATMHNSMLRVSLRPIYRCCCLRTNPCVRSDAGFGVFRESMFGLFASYAIFSQEYSTVPSNQSPTYSSIFVVLSAIGEASSWRPALCPALPIVAYRCLWVASDYVCLRCLTLLRCN